MALSIATAACGIIVALALVANHLGQRLDRIARCLEREAEKRDYLANR